MKSATTNTKINEIYKYIQKLYFFRKINQKPSEKLLKSKKYKIRQKYGEIYDLSKTPSKITRKSQTKYFVPAGPPGPA